MSNIFDSTQKKEMTAFLPLAGAIGELMVHRL